MELDKKKYAYNYFIQKGLPPVIASGIVGNLIHESGLDTSIEGDKGLKGGSSYGIAQWRGDRLTNLQKRYGDNWTNLDNQLDFVLHELNSSEKTTFNKLKYAKTPEEASDIFMRGYERPSKEAISKSGVHRAKNARDLFGSSIDSNYVSQYQEPLIVEEELTNYLPTPITLQEKRADNTENLSYEYKANEAKKQIQEYQQVEDLIQEMPTFSQEVPKQEVIQQRPSYEYLYNQDLFTIQ